MPSLRTIDVYHVPGCYKVGTEIASWSREDGEVNGIVVKREKLDEFMVRLTVEVKSEAN